MRRKAIKKAPSKRKADGSIDNDDDDDDDDDDDVTVNDSQNITPLDQSFGMYVCMYVWYEMARYGII